MSAEVQVKEARKRVDGWRMTDVQSWCRPVQDGRLEWDGMHRWRDPRPSPPGGADQNSPFFLIGMADSVNV